MNRSNGFVGRAVSLKQELFKNMVERRKKGVVSTENLFVVAAMTGNMRRLICYGGSECVEVGLTDVIFV